METNFLQSLASKSLPSTIHILTKPFTTIPQTQILLPFRRQSLRVSSTNSTSSSDTSGKDDPPMVPPPQDTVEIRFKRGSRRRARQLQEDGDGVSPIKAKAKAPIPKKWEDMSLTEKAIELYVGEKGALFWLNKFAYASIYIVIGAWILFRFVGPALNLYQLDTPPLPPTSMFKGS
ncbi:hypothetical protein CFOL_v3_30947 [Cephalotus follicularis]|uniref:Transmembrane protein n=1 Tax=Cephalotus follicularis TaxID=3775 RepID=A0A1Q3D531_CEPFO|nr:hypothetical protein CFOL_v3_30947 [Cephalotus follicularis]